MRRILSLCFGVGIVFAFAGLLWWVFGPVGMAVAMCLIFVSYGAGLVVHGIARNALERDRQAAERRARRTW